MIGFELKISDFGSDIFDNWTTSAAEYHQYLNNLNYYKDASPDI